jgi:hypothetical protein
MSPAVPSRPSDPSSEFGDSSPDDVEIDDPHAVGWLPPQPSTPGFDSSPFPWEPGF